ncbi:MAG: 5'/3'-nucleotidase SurE [Gammaproteobacteria bacterium]|nr:MAG: 5'/3'-nucleotidase SurE [Gammaproteobacteria bacterium]
MNILISNDDGVGSPGLRVLAEEIASIAVIRVVAPDRDHSGASNSLTLNRPLKLEQTPDGYYSVDGTPTDCVHLGVTNLFDLEFARVVSGINSHANLGDDVIYSGTVAAAMEGRFLDCPAIAISLANAGNNHYATAARVVKNIVVNGGSLKLSPRTILNVNVPDLPFDQLKGIEITRLGYRVRGGHPEKVIDPRGVARYWIGAAGEGDDAGPGTDFYAISQDRVSITPIHADMTRYDELSSLNMWSDGVF